MVHRMICDCRHTEKNMVARGVRWGLDHRLPLVSRVVIPGRFTCHF